MACAVKTNSKLVLSPADLRNQITIERSVTTKTASGGQNHSHTTFATVFCSITPLSGRWAMMDGQTQATGYFKIRMRYLRGLLNSDRVNFGGRIMDIKEIMNIDERNLVHELTVQENMSNG